MADAAEKNTMNLCNICGKKYKLPQDLKRHEMGHAGKGPYRCCGRAFRDKNTYVQHRCNKHGAPKRFTCTHMGCGSTFANNYSLKRHANEVHPQGPRRYSCETCNQDFCYRHQLSEHVSTKHDAEKKHRCAECGKRYVYRSGLSRHQNTCIKKQN